MGLLKHHKTRLDSKGSVLVSLIVTMVILAALGAAMVSLTSTSMFGQVGANSSARAYYLAESGYRYAESKYLAAAMETARDIELENLHNAPNFTLLNNAGQFDIKVYPYFFKVVTNPVGTSTLSTKVVGGFPTDIALSPGRLKIGTKASSIYNYNSTSPPVPLDGQNITFNMTQTLPYFPVNTDVLPVALMIPQTVNEGGALLLQAGTANAFPLRNGTFQVKINNKYHVYAYKENDLANNQLLGVTDPKVSPMLPLIVAANSDIILQKFVKLYSTGIFGQGSVEGAASRELVYHVPLPSAAEERKEFKETFADLTNWNSSTLGTFAVQDIGGSALRVTGTGSLGGTLTGSLIRFDPSALNIDLPAAHLYGDPYFLSYDAQVKTGFITTSTPPGGGYDPSPIPKYFAAGLSFRLDNDNNSYGLSFLRGDSTDPALDNLDDNIVPTGMNNKTLIVLWQGTGFGNTRKWLAYKKDLALFFKDNMESGTNGWTVTGTDANVKWHQSTHRAYSPTQAWYYGREGSWNYNTFGSANSGNLVSPSIDLSQATSATLTFWTWFLTEGPTIFLDKKLVEVSTDGGVSWPPGSPIPENFGNWVQKSYDLSAYCGQTIKIRFRFDTVNSINNSFEGWYIDDVRISGHTAASINEATLAVRIKEVASVQFTSNQAVPIVNGDTIVGQNSGARGIVSGSPIISSGSWALSNVIGTLMLRNVTDAFVSETVNVIGSAAAATVSGFRSRDNFIRAYYGTAGGYGTPDSNPLDSEKKANPRGSVNWPPDELADWSATNDYFTLVQWDAVNTGVTLISSVDERNAIIRDNTLTSPTSGPLLQPELGLHTFGRGSTNVYFDDFAVQADVGSSSNIGFVRTIQE